MSYTVEPSGFILSGGLVSKETVRWVGGKVKHLNKLSTTKPVK